VKNILQKVEQTLSAFQMIKGGDRILTAVSGGPDSTALLHILNTIAPRYEVELGVVHLNHGLRGRASDRDAEFTQQIAQGYDLPFYGRKEDLRRRQIRQQGSLEELARTIRHAYFQEIADRHNYSKIALGHHQHDNAELVLMFMLRGSGTLGLSGMAPVGPPNLIRPLIELSRNDIHLYLKDHRLVWRFDDSNTDFQFLRNQIRYQLLPQLIETYNPRLIETLNRSANVMREEQDWMASIIQPIYDECKVAQPPPPLGRHVVLAVGKLRRLHKAPLRRIIRRAIQEVNGNLRRIGYQHIEAICQLLKRRYSKGEIHLPNQVRILLTARELHIRKEDRPLRSQKKRTLSPRVPLYEHTIPHSRCLPYTVIIKDPALQLIFTPITIKDLGNTRDTGHQVAFFDMDKVKFPLTVRTFLAGDRFIPLGMKGSQKIKKYFINCKVPPSQRSKIPILTDHSAILWVVGYRMGDDCKITPTTCSVLQVELKYLLNNQ
jgi:tRNA(Ile)-lysidine synthase